MPKAVLEFKLPEENEEFKDANNGLAYRCALEDVYNYIRDMTKHGSYEGAKTKEQLATHIYEKFNEILGENDIRLF